MPRFEANIENSKKLRASLEEYMHGNVLTAGGDFICSHRNECEASCKRDGVDFYEGQLHHVGDLYDLKRDGKPFRVVISGAEYGRDQTKVSISSRTEWISAEEPNNWHMKGVLLLLQMLFGEELDNSQLKTNINDEEHRILEAFSLPNFLLCSALQKPDENGNRNTNGRPTDEMLQNCGNHYQKMMEILQPQIIILQGVRSREFFQDRHDIRLDYKNPEVEKITISGKPVLVLPLWHPAYEKNSWGRKEVVENYVKPAVDKLLECYEKM